MATDVTTLGMAVDSSGVTKATDALDKFSKSGKTATDSATEYEKAMQRAAANGVVIGQGIVEVAKAAIRGAEAFVGLGLSLGKYQDLAEQVGSDNPAGLASLQVAADVAGVSVEGAVLSMNRLTYQLARVKDEGAPAAKALQAIGIDFESFRKLNPDDQYKKLATELGKYADSSEKATVAQVLFGRGGAQQLRMMKELASQSQASVLITNEQIRAADDLGDMMARSRSEMKQMGQVLAAESLPALSVLAEVTSSAAKELLGLDQKTGKLKGNSGVADFAEGAVMAFGYMVDGALGVLRVLRAIGQSIGSVASAMVLAAQGEFRAAWTALGEGGKDVRDTLTEDWLSFSSRTNKALEELRTQRAKLAAEGGEGEDGKNKPRINASGLLINDNDNDKNKKAKIDEVTKSLQKLREEVETYGMEDYEKRLFEFSNLKGANAHLAEFSTLLSKLKVSEQSKAVQDFIKSLKEESDTLGMTSEQLVRYTLGRKGATQADIEQAAELQRGIDLKQKRIDAERDATKATEEALGPTARYIKDLERINELDATGKLSIEARAKATKEAWERYKDGIKDAKKETTELDEFSKQGARNIQDALGKATRSVLEGDFKSIGRTFKSVIIEMIAQAQSAQLAKWLLGDFGKTGDVGGLFGSMIKGIGGLFGGTGTVDLGNVTGADMDVFTLMSAGNKLSYDGFKAAPQSAAAPSDKAMSVGGPSVSVVQHITLQGAVSQQDLNNAMLTAKDAAKAEIAQMLSGRSPTTMR